MDADRDSGSAGDGPKTAGGLPPGSARDAMQDVLMLMYTAIFFGLAFLYVKACQKLR
jgi:hypothetical protein